MIEPTKQLVLARCQTLTLPFVHTSPLGRWLTRSSLVVLIIPMAGVPPPALLEAAGFDSLMGWATTTSTSMHLEGDLPPLASNSALS